MAKNNNLYDFLKDLADGIRAKKGTSESINPQDFRTEIESIQTGEQIDIENGYLCVLGQDTRINKVMKNVSYSSLTSDEVIPITYTWESFNCLTVYPTEEKFSYGLSYEVHYNASDDIASFLSFSDYMEPLDNNYGYAVKLNDSTGYALVAFQDGNVNVMEPNSTNGYDVVETIYDYNIGSSSLLSSYTFPLLFGNEGTEIEASSDAALDFFFKLLQLPKESKLYPYTIKSGKFTDYIELTDEIYGEQLDISFLTSSGEYIGYGFEDSGTREPYIYYQNFGYPEGEGYGALNGVTIIGVYCNKPDQVLRVGKLVPQIFDASYVLPAEEAFAIGQNLQGKTINTTAEIARSFTFSDLGVNTGDGSYTSGEISINLSNGDRLVVVNGDGNANSIYLYVASHEIWNYYYSEPSAYTFDDVYEAVIESYDITINGYGSNGGYTFDTSSVTNEQIAAKISSILTVS